MSVRILEDRESFEACFYCSTSMWAFGPVMANIEQAEAFLDWLPRDPREYNDNELESKYAEFLHARDLEIAEAK
jgi:hypothetical protein